MNLITQNNLTMSSKEIAELTGKRHDHVLVDIRKMLAEINSPEKSGQYKDSTNRTLPMLLLDKDEALCLVSGYNAKMRMAIIKRWQELERGTPKLPNFNSPAESARAWAEQFEANQIAQQQLAEAQPKIDFVDRYVDGTGLKKFRDVCRILNVKENAFRVFLINSKIMYRLDGRYAAYKIHIDAGRFQDKTGTAGHNNYAFTETLFTAKGVEWIAGEWAKYNLREQA